jgi:hypothetical protein
MGINTIRRIDKIESNTGTNIDISPNGGNLVIETGNVIAENIKKNNLTSSDDPTITDDDTLGYEQGSIWINQSSGSSFSCSDNTTGAAVWVPTGGGGGAGTGGVDSYYVEEFEDIEIGDVTSGNGASVGTGGGGLNGTLSLETALPQKGSQSLKFTQDAASQNDWFYPPAPTLDRYAKAKDNTFICYVKHTGSDDELKVVIWDDNNSQDLIPNYGYIKSTGSSTIAKRYEFKFFPPENAGDLFFALQVVGAGNAGAETTVEAFEANSSGFIFREIANDTNWQNYTGGTFQGITSFNSEDLKYRLSGGDLLIQGSIDVTVSNASLLQVPLPSGFIASDVLNADYEIVGNCGREVGVGGAQFTVIAKQGSTVLEFGLQFSFTAGLNPTAGNAIITGAGDFSFYARIPVEGYGATTEVVYNPSHPVGFKNLNQEIVIEATTTNPTKPTTTLTDTIYIDKVNDLAFLKYNLAWNSNAGAVAGSGDYLFKLPTYNGIQLEFSPEIPFYTGAITTSGSTWYKIWGTGSISHDSSSHIQQLGIVPYDSTRFRVHGSSNAASLNAVSPPYYPLTLNAGNYNFEFFAPIASWSGTNVNVSPLIKVAQFAYTEPQGTAGQSIGTGWQTVPVNEFIAGTPSIVGFNPITSRFKFYQGRYKITCEFNWDEYTRLTGATFPNLSTRIFDTDNNIEKSRSTNAYMDTASLSVAVNGLHVFVAYIEVIDPFEWEWQFYTDFTYTNGLGKARNKTGEKEIYDRITIEKM